MNDTLVAGRYRLGRKIGTGGMGRVWLARDEVLRRSVAVKEVLLPEAPSEDEAYELRMRTLREARAAARLSHPNVVRVYDVMYAEDRPWIVMEYIPSRSLAQVIKVDGPLEPAQVARVGIAVLDALLAAHAAGVLHRDVKPGNVLLADDGRVVLTDFGLATFDEIGTNLTQSGVVHGSPQFIAPERALDGTSTVEADMWSLGATLYAAVEGQSPYSRPTSYQTLAALATAPPDPPRRAGALKPVLAGLLRRNPRSRMKPHEVRTRLQRVAGGEAGRFWLVPRTRRNPGDQPTTPGGNWQGPTPAPMPQVPMPQMPMPQMPMSQVPMSQPAMPQAPAGPAGASGRAAVNSPAAPTTATGSTATGSTATGSTATGSTASGSAATGSAGSAAVPASPGRAKPVPPLPRREPPTVVQPKQPIPAALLNAPRRPSATGPGTAKPAGPGDRHRTRLRATVAAVAVLMVASAGYVAYRLVAAGGRPAHGHSRGGPPSGPVAPPRSATSAAPGIVDVPQSAGVGWPCPAAIPGDSVAVPVAPPDAERPGLAGNLIWYADRQGMLVPVLPGWQMVRGGGATCFYDGSLPRSLSVGRVAAPPGSTPVGVLAAMDLAARGRIPGYHRIGKVHQVGFLVDQAEWEYTYHGATGTMHTIVRDYLRTGRAYLVQWTTTEDSWPDNQPIYPVIATGFHPPTS